MKGLGGYQLSSAACNTIPAKCVLRHTKAGIWFMLGLSAASIRGSSLADHLVVLLEDLDNPCRAFTCLGHLIPELHGRVLNGLPLALFVDYDGTLTPIVDHPSRALLSDNTRAALRTLASRPDTNVTVVSGRALAGVRELVGVEGLTYAGNHGMEIVGPGLEPFRHEALAGFEEKTEELARSLDEIGAPGAWVEKKGATLTFHFREAEESAHHDLAEDARLRIEAAGFDLRDAHCAVEARPPIAWDKGQAVLHVLRNRYGPDWAESVRVIYIGDDQTDEDALHILAGLGVTFRVGSADTPTAASRLLSNVAAVEALLSWLAERARS